MMKLESERTLLRSFQKEDLPELIELMSDPEVMKYTGFRKPQTEEKIKESLSKWSNDDENGLGVWCVEKKGSGEFVGWFMLKDTGHPYPEIGFMLAKKMWGQGLATEVSKTLLRYAFKTLKKEKVIASTVSENDQSISVIKKLGMKRSKIQLEKDHDYEILCFEIDRDSYLLREKI